MGCQIQGGRGRQCNDTIGGIKEVFVGLFSDFEDAVTVDESTSDTHSVTELPTATLYRFTLDSMAGHGTYTETINASLENGTTFYEQVLEVYLPKITMADHANLRDIVPSQVSLFVRYNDKNSSGKDVIAYLGNDFGGRVSGGTIDSGSALGDRQGYTITWTARSKTPAHILEDYTTSPFDNYTGITIDPAY